MSNNIRSTAVSGDYLDTILLPVMKEISETMEAVFGPKGNDIFISTQNDNSLYFTRDGKQVFHSINFDNLLANQIKTVIGQAVNHQADAIGDSTTSIALIMSKIILALKEVEKYEEVHQNSFDTKRAILDIIKRLKAYIKLRAVELEYKDDLYKSLIFTTTGDMSFYETIANNISSITADSYIDVQSNEFLNETTFEVDSQPSIATSIQYNRRPLSKAKDDEFYVIDNTAILYVDGALAIYKKETILLMSFLYVLGIDNLCIMCASVDKSTNDTIREFNKEYAGMFGDGVKKFTNIHFLKLPEYMGFTKEDQIDISTIIYDTSKDINVGSSFDYELRLYHATQELLIKSGLVSDPALIDLMNNEEYNQWDGDDEIINVIKNTLMRTLTIELSDRETRLPAYSSEERTLRVEKIMSMIDKTTSVIQKRNYVNRLKRFSSNKIIVKLGANYIANSQKDAELLLDALKASKVAFKNGVIKTNGLTLVREALLDLQCAVDIETVDLANTFINELFTITEGMLLKIYNKPEQFGMLYFKGEYHSSVMMPDDSVICVCEPTDSILAVLDGLALAVDIVFSKVFTTKDFMFNYI